VLGLFVEASEDEEAEIAGPIVITDGGSAGDAFPRRTRGISPPEGGAAS
jgi:hypothetical protein